MAAFSLMVPVEEFLFCKDVVFSAVPPTSYPPSECSVEDNFVSTLGRPTHPPLPFNASGLEPAPIRRADEPSDGGPKPHAREADAPSGPEPTRNVRRRSGDTR